eukprot:Partr_v1_DN25666_c0_g1_i1_m4900 putative Nucleolar protein
MLVLFETPAGYAIFKVLDEGKLESADMAKAFSTADSAQGFVKLKAFKKFANTAEALSAATAIVEGKLDSQLKKFLRDELPAGVHDKLAIADSKLGAAVAKKLGIKVVSDSASVHELMRGIRSQLDSLITGLSGSELTAMQLGLAHSLSRYKLKFSPDKVDTMIVQAIGLLDDLDKELNTYSMRVKEWFGWHFPEMTKVVVDNVAYSKCVIKMTANRVNCAELAFDDILPEEIETELKNAAEISMGTEMADTDVFSVMALCQQVISLHQYRAQLYEYLKNRMQAIAPNLTALVGELVGARLIAHAGSLLNLAKHPASTIQILGAEKALFRALKAKKDTPKYGLIYHASLVGQAAVKTKGKMARMVAAKAALASRVDALAEQAVAASLEDGSSAVEAENPAELGLRHRAKLEHQLNVMEGRAVSIASKANRQAAPPAPRPVSFDKTAVPATYNTAADSTLPSSKKDKKKSSKKDKKEIVDELKAIVQEEKPAVVEESSSSKKKSSKEDMTEEERKAHKKAKKEKKRQLEAAEESGKKKKSKSS